MAKPKKNYVFGNKAGKYVRIPFSEFGISGPLSIPTRPRNNYTVGNNNGRIVRIPLSALGLQGSWVPAPKRDYIRGVVNGKRVRIPLSAFGKPALKKYPAIANNAIYTGSGSFGNAGGQQGATYQSQYTAVVAETKLRAIFGNFLAAQDGPNPITIMAGLVVGSTYTRITFNGGSTSVTLPPGGDIVSDTVLTNLTAGQTFYIQTFVSVANAGEKWPVGYVNIKYTPGMTDYSVSALPGNTFQQGFAPVTVLGETANAGDTLVIGDSILTGSGDTGSNQGFWVRAIGNSRAYTRLSLPGETLQTFFGVTFTGDVPSGSANGSSRRKFAAGYKIAVVEYGNNDIYVSKLNVNQMKNLAVYAAKELKKMGAQKVYFTTVTPRTTSTDSWATVDNQTPVNGVGEYDVLIAYNDWLRNNLPPEIDGVFDTAATVMAQKTAAPNHWVWKAPGYVSTGDGAQGIHPLLTGHTAMAAAIDQAKLV